MNADLTDKSTCTVCDWFCAEMPRQPLFSRPCRKPKPRKVWWTATRLNKWGMIKSLPPAFPLRHGPPAKFGCTISRTDARRLHVKDTEKYKECTQNPKFSAWYDLLVAHGTYKTRVPFIRVLSCIVIIQLKNGILHTSLKVFWKRREGIRRLHGFPCRTIGWLMPWQMSRSSHSSEWNWETAM